jgi:hypothetical protein
MSKKTQCELGLTKHEKKCGRDWLRLKKSKALGSVSSSVPAPPAPGTPAAAKCYSRWMYCWQEAQIIDALNADIQQLQVYLAYLRTLKPVPTGQVNLVLKQIAAKQQEVRLKMNALAQQKLAYYDCLRGRPV